MNNDMYQPSVIIDNWQYWCLPWQEAEGRVKPTSDIFLLYLLLVKGWRFSCTKSFESSDSWLICNLKFTSVMYRKLQKADWWADICTGQVFKTFDRTWFLKPKKGKPVSFLCPAPPPPTLFSSQCPPPPPSHIPVPLQMAFSVFSSLVLKLLTQSIVFRDSNFVSSPQTFAGTN